MTWYTPEMIRLVQIALYLVTMTALGWALWQVVPGAVGWLDGTLGTIGSGVLIFGMIPVAYLIAYLAGRRDSGRA